jgi:hypothetical protein
MLTKLDKQQIIMLVTIFVSGVILVGLMFQTLYCPNL